MKTETGKYKIELFRDETYSRKSSDNQNSYNKVYFDQTEYVATTQIGINIFEDGKWINSAIIGAVGGGTGIHNTSQIIEKKRIVICCSDSLFCLSVPELDLIWKTQADQATCFEIFKVKDSYIVHGELEISRIDLNGKIMWQKGGADIFTTLEGTDVFSITESYIKATDWDNRVYKFDFDGNLID